MAFVADFLSLSFIFIYPPVFLVVVDSGTFLRFWEIDFLRGIAIVMMICFHGIYDLSYFGGYSFAVQSGFWWYFARATASLFLLLVGISLTLSYSRMTQVACPPDLFWKYGIRGAKIFGWGLIISFITGVFLSEGIILFGILHCIGISIFLGYFLIPHRYIALVGGIICVAVGVYLNQFTFSFQYLLWLGFRSQGIYMFDYVPLLPWFGLVAIGIYLGNTMYSNYTRKFSLQDFSTHLGVKLLCTLGKKSLLIYLIHQPLLLLILFSLGHIPL